MYLVNSMKKIFFLLLLCSSFFHSFGGTVVSGGGTAAATICPGNDIIYNFQLAQFGGAATLNTVNFTTTGTYGATEVANYKLWISTTNTFATATNIGSPIVAGLLPGVHSFTAIAYALAGGGGPGTTYYCWITANVPATAVIGKTIAVSAMPTANVVVSTGGTFGPGATVGGTQTINNVPTGVTATATPVSLCVGSNLTLTGAATGATSYSWAGPAGSGYTAAVLNPAAFATTAADAGVYTLTATNACGNTTANTVSVSVNPLPAAITGTTTVCAGAITTLTETATGGTWSSTAPGVATVDASGDVFGVAAGTTTINYTIGGTLCSTSILVTVTAAPTAILGSPIICQTLPTTLSDGIAGGTWSISSGVPATISAAGVVTGLTAGVDTVTYTASGCATTLTITVNSLPTPGAITGISTICVGSNTSLTDTPAGGSWVSGAPLIATIDASGNVFGVTRGIVTMTYNVTNSCGTTGATFAMMIESPASAITGPSIVCIGNTISLVDSEWGGTWSETTGNASVSGMGYVTGTAAGTDIIQYSVTNLCGTSTVTFPVTIGVPAVVGTISGPSYVCMGSTITLSETATGGVWSATNGTASINAATGVVNTIVSGIDTFIYTVSAACGNTTTNFAVAIDSVTNPIVALSSDHGTSVCSDVPVTYFASTLYGGSSPMFEWTVNGFAISDTDSTYTYIPSNGDIIKCTLVTSYLCATVASAKDSVTMTVIPVVLPTVHVSAGILGDTVCLGQVSSFSATSTYGGATPFYQWSRNGVNTVIGTAYSYTPSNGDIVKCTLISSHICAVPDTVADSVTMTVNTSETPIIDVTISPSDTVCFGTIVTCTAHGVYGGTSPSYLWIKNGVNVATGVSFSYTPANLDTIRCKFYSNSPCAVAAVTTSANHQLHTKAANVPILNIISSQGATVPFGGTDTFTVLVAGAGTAPTFQWVLNGVIVPGATSNIFVLSDIVHSDSVACIVTGTLLGDCPGVESTIYTNIKNTNAGVYDVKANDIQAYIAPNPNNGNFRLIGNAAFAGKLHIVVTNLLGQEIYASEISADNGIVDTTVNCGNMLSPGVYLLHVTTDSRQKTLKFVVNK
jgi:trimeric autotransporter adhesin